MYSVLHHVEPINRKKLISDICRVTKKFVLLKDYVIDSDTSKWKQHTLECVIQHEIFSGIVRKVENPMVNTDYCDCRFNLREVVVHFEKHRFFVIQEISLRNTMGNMSLILLQAQWIEDYILATFRKYKTQSPKSSAFLLFKAEDKTFLDVGSMRVRNSLKLSIEFFLFRRYFAFCFCFGQSAPEPSTG